MLVGVCVGVEVNVAVLLGVGVLVGVSVGVAVIVAVGVGVNPALTDGVGVKVVGQEEGSLGFRSFVIHIVKVLSQKYSLRSVAFKQ